MIKTVVINDYKEFRLVNKYGWRFITIARKAVTKTITKKSTRDKVVYRASIAE